MRSRYRTPLQARTDEQISGHPQALGEERIIDLTVCVQSLQQFRKSQALSMAKQEHKPLQHASPGNGSHSSRKEQGKIKNVSKRITLFQQKMSTLRHERPLVLVERTPALYRKSIVQKKKTKLDCSGEQEHIAAMKALWSG